MAKQKQDHSLTLWILSAIVLAIVAALVGPLVAIRFRAVEHLLPILHLGGEVFLNLLKMIVVPLVITSVMTGILGLGDIRKLGKPGAAAVGYYLCTTVLAVIVGLIVVNVMQPGVGAVDQERLDAIAAEHQADETIAGRETPSIGTILTNMVLMLFTDNLFKETVETNLLPLIIFSIIFAGVLTTMDAKVDTLKQIISQANDALMVFVLLLMRLAPLGIFCLVAARFWEAQAKGQFLDELKSIGIYVVTVLVGLAIHAFITLPAIYWIFTRQNPYVYVFRMARALLTAFSTASSSATLPVTMEVAEEAGVSSRATDFVLPLGATINMDGTALYEAVAAIFIAQAIGMPLGAGAMVTIAITATLAAIGAAGIPEAGLITMLIVLEAVGLPLEYVALILPVDWLLDRFRTAVNVWGDSVGAAVVDITIPTD